MIQLLPSVVKSQNTFVLIQYLSITIIKTEDFTKRFAKLFSAPTKLQNSLSQTYKKDLRHVQAGVWDWITAFGES